MARAMMRHAPRPDMTGCDEQRAWDNGHQRDVMVCVCGTAGIESRKVAVRDWQSFYVELVVVHNFTLAPVIVFEPDAVSVGCGVLLGPGLHRAIERHRTVTCTSRDGVLYDMVEEYTVGE